MTLKIIELKFLQDENNIETARIQLVFFYFTFIPLEKSVFFLFVISKLVWSSEIKKTDMIL